MRNEELEKRRARYVRTILAWHESGPADLAGLLGVTVDTVYKKLDARRAFTTGDLLTIGGRFGIEPGLLLWPPEVVEALGAPVTGISGSVCPRPAAGQFGWAA